MTSVARCVLAAFLALGHAARPGTRADDPGRLQGRELVLDATLATMVREHADHERPLRDLVEACDEIALDPRGHAELAPSLATAARELQAHFAEHLRREEEVIFPAMQRYLDAAASAAIVAEIRARRDVPLGGIA